MMAVMLYLRMARRHKDEKMAEEKACLSPRRAYARGTSAVDRR